MLQDGGDRLQIELYFKAYSKHDWLRCRALKEQQRKEQVALLAQVCPFLCVPEASKTSGPAEVAELCPARALLTSWPDHVKPPCFVVASGCHLNDQMNHKIGAICHILL